MHTKNVVIRVQLLIMTSHFDLIDPRTRALVVFGVLDDWRSLGGSSNVCSGTRGENLSLVISTAKRIHTRILVLISDERMCREQQN